MALARDSLGLGLRIPHYDYIFEHWPALDYFEVITENFLGDAAPPRQHLARICERYPVVLHGVTLNLLGPEAPDPKYLDEVARLADLVEAQFVTDHLCWTGAHGAQHHDLLPVPYTEEVVELAVHRAERVQRHLQRPFGIENLSTYVEFRRSEMPEWEFYRRVVTESGCWFMLDINNVYVSSVNHGFDPHDYLEAVDFTRVLQVHLAGPSQDPDGTLVDTHDRPVPDAVWDLYRAAWQRGPFPTLVEWDDAIPPMPAVLSELSKARQVRA